jgi:hypothetical protein
MMGDAGDSRAEEVLQLLKETPWVLVPLKGKELFLLKNFSGKATT